MTGQEDRKRRLDAAVCRYEAAVRMCAGTPASHPDYPATVLVRDTCERTLIRMLTNDRTVHPFGQSLYWVECGELNRGRRHSTYRLDGNDLMSWRKTR